eukprot:g4717.t1
MHHPKGLEALANYKYVSGSYTPIDLRLNSFWLWCTELLPMWLAPNAVTLTGLGFVALSTIFISISNPTMDGSADQVSQIVAAACLFIYQTLDAMDGKQARRTGSSSPLGQLFDHGCDGMSTLLMNFNVASTLRLGASWKALLLLCCTQHLFFMGQWKESHTHVMQTNVGGFFGVTEVQLIVVALHLIAAFAPEQTWVDTHNVMGYELTVGEIVLAVVVASSYALLVPAMMRSVLTDPAVDKLKAASDHVALVSVYSLAAAGSSGILPSLNSMFQAQPVLMIIAFGLMGVHLSNQMIVAAMCRTNFAPTSALTAPVLLLCALQEYGKVTSNAGASAIFIISAIIYVGNTLGCIAQICDYLGIRCLTIPYTSTDKKKK